jgi:hypothetical protein
MPPSSLKRINGGNGIRFVPMMAHGRAGLSKGLGTHLHRQCRETPASQSISFSYTLRD